MPLEKRPEQAHRGPPAAASRRPFHLRLPDVFADEKPHAAPGPERHPPQQAAAYDPIAKVRSQLSAKRYRDGHQQVTGLIERLRERRRKLLDRLWVASIALTALSIVALAVELIQEMHSSIATPAAIPGVDQADSQSQLARTTSAPPARPVSSAAASGSPDNHPVKSALYTTEEGPEHKGARLDGWITAPDPDSE